MSLEEKAGQVFLVSVLGRARVAARSAQILRRIPVGGVILFGYNVRGGPAQVASLVSSLQRLAAQSGARVPYLVAVDHEGGRVQRLRRGFTRLPPPRRLGALGPDRLEELAFAVGQQLRSVGVNMNLAPVVEASAGDLDVIGDRSFAATARSASPLAAAFVRGMQRAGVVATAKHFPGNARSTVDPHRAMPRIELSPSEIEKLLLPPFESAVAAGVDAVMLAHVEMPALDDERPAALSPQVVRGLLRRRIGFAGMVVSDDLLMKAVTERFDPARAAVMALRAGTDLLMVSNAEELPRIHAEVVRAVRAGELAEEQLDEAVRHILEVKYRRGVWPGHDEELRPDQSLLARARRRADRLLRGLGEHLSREGTAKRSAE